MEILRNIAFSLQKTKNPGFFSFSKCFILKIQTLYIFVRATLRSKTSVFTIFLGATLFMGASATSWWDMSPEVIREKINERIMAIEAPVPVVGSMEDRFVNCSTRITPIRIYTPINGADFPIILLIHCGAWVAGNLDTHDNLARYLCTETKALVVSVGYLNPPEGKFPLPLEQCYDALNWICEQRLSFQLDASRIAVAGDSAGGNMAAGLCLMARDQTGPKIDLQVLINPAPDLTCKGTLGRKDDELDILRWQAVQYLADPKDANNPYVSPLVTHDLSRFQQRLSFLLSRTTYAKQVKNLRTACRLQEYLPRFTVS